MMTVLQFVPILCFVKSHLIVAYIIIFFLFRIFTSQEQKSCNLLQFDCNEVPAVGVVVEGCEVGVGLIQFGQQQQRRVELHHRDHAALHCILLRSI